MSAGGRGVPRQPGRYNNWTAAPRTAGLTPPPPPPSRQHVSNEQIPMQKAPLPADSSTVRPTKAAIKTTITTIQAPPPQQAVPSKSSRLSEAESNDLFGRVLELRNFPTAWMTKDALPINVRISRLLEKYGPLEKAPCISMIDEKPVVTVTYMNRGEAESAKNNLDGVDNRSKEEKKQQPGAPLEHQKLSVNVVPRELLHASSSGSASHGNRQVVGSSITGQAADFTPIMSKLAEADLRILKPSELIKKAYDAGATQEEVHKALDDSNLVELILSKQHEVDSPEVEEVSCNDFDEEPGAPDVEAKDDEEPITIYVDELMQASGSGAHCEVFLQNLPIEEYEELALREWLSSFGTCKSVHFTKDKFGELTGQGYVCFDSQDDAMDLFESLSDDAASKADEDMKILPSWSLSEEMKRGVEGQRRRDAMKHVQARLRQDEGPRRAQAPCKTGRGITFVQDSGPLHFVCFADHGRGTVGNLRAYLMEVLQTAFNELHSQAEASSCSKVALDRSTSAAIAPAPEPELSCKVPVHVSPHLPGGLDSWSKKPLPAAIVELSGAPVCVESRGGLDTSTKDPPLAGIVEPLGGFESSNKPSPAVVAEPSGGPACVVVRGFTPNWQADEVKRVFAIYGGVVALKFVEDAIGRSAIVELKSEEKAQIAIAKMNNFQVGDGETIEECTLLVQPFGASIQPASLKAIFLDELPMEGRPQLPASSRDCEVFLLNLPMDDHTEADIGEWLKCFGLYKDFNLLRDTTGVLSKKGYVRFLDHKHAAGCVRACGEEYENETSMVARWSESERAEHRSDSVYGFDVHDAFTQKQLEDILCETKIQHLWVYSPAQKAPPKWPTPQGDQFHFLVACTKEQVASVRARLDQALHALYLRHGYSPTATSTAAGSSHGNGESVAVDSSAQPPPKASVEPEVAKLTDAVFRPHPIYGRVTGPEAIAKLDEGEALLAQGVQRNEGDSFEEAIKPYRKGIQCLIDCIPDVEMPGALRQRIDACLCEVEKLRTQEHQAKDAKDLFQQGDEFETKKNYAAAFHLWTKGLKALNNILKGCGDPPSELTKIFKKYLEKAEDIKKRINVDTEKKGARSKAPQSLKAPSMTTPSTPVSGIGATISSTSFEDVRASNMSHEIQNGDLQLDASQVTASSGDVSCLELQGNTRKRKKHDSPKGARPVAKATLSSQDFPGSRTKAASSAPVVAIAKSSLTGIVPGPPPSGPPASTQPVRRALLVGKAKAKAKS